MTLTVYSIDGVVPVVDPTAYVHPSAVLIGDVIVGAGCYIGPFASLRGDFGGIRVHAGANIQDSCVMHGFPGTDTTVEENGHIGHAAVLHSCVIGKNALVGMNAVVNDNAVIGEGAIVAAMAFVKAGTVVPPRTLVAGIPARVVRTVTDQELEWKRSGTESYQELTRRCLATMKATAPLAAVEPGRRAFKFDEVIPLHVFKERNAP
jgi:phenylacetic acid degradation protein